MQESSASIAQRVYRLYCGFLLLAGIAWALDLPLALGISMIEAEWLGPYLGVAVAAAFLASPYRERAGAIEISLGFISIASWLWLSVNYGEWLIDIAGHTPQKYLPGIAAIALMLEAIRKSCGLPISLLALALIIYGLLGFNLPWPLQADRVSPEALVMYLYSDSNAILGLVLGIIASLVLAFIVFGKLMEVSGATRFFTDAAMALMGHRRGGPAKIAVVASSMMGSINGSPVANIMSTGVVTIPLMKRTGFKAHHAAAIEAVASTGGQIAPPVMGATAFLIADFLQISYTQVALAALLPAIFYYVCLFLQVDADARRYNLAGVPKADLPALRPVLRAGWIFIAPLALLVYLLFFENSPPSRAALASALALLVLALLRGHLRSRDAWSELIFGGGANIIPLVLIGGAAGVVIGIMSITGLGMSLSFVLVQIGESSGLLTMLILTAGLSIMLGMGMPSAAIYVVLASVLGPALIQMGVPALAAHLFIFYFGVLSFLTPPVAVASYVAAGLAGSDMWRTGWAGLRFGAVAFVLPFVWIYNPALVLQGSTLAIAIVCCTTVCALLCVHRAGDVARSANTAGRMLAAAWLLGALGIATSTVWLGAESLFALAIAVLGALLYAATARRDSTRSDGIRWSADDPPPAA